MVHYVQNNDVVLVKRTTSRFYSPTDGQDSSDQTSNSSSSTEDEQKEEAQWDAANLLPPEFSFKKGTFAVILLIVFGVMGFAVNLFLRVIFLYCEWQDGNEINWKQEAFFTFTIPAAYVVVMLELMAILT